MNMISHFNKDKTFQKNYIASTKNSITNTQNTAIYKTLKNQFTNPNEYLNDNLEGFIVFGKKSDKPTFEQIYDDDKREGSQNRIIKKQSTIISISNLGMRKKEKSITSFACSTSPEKNNDNRTRIMTSRSNYEYVNDEEINQYFQKLEKNKIVNSNMSNLNNLNNLNNTNIMHTNPSNKTNTNTNNNILHTNHTNNTNTNTNNQFNLIDSFQNELIYKHNKKTELQDTFFSQEKSIKHMEDTTNNFNKTYSRLSKLTKRPVSDLIMNISGENFRIKKEINNLLDFKLNPQYKKYGRNNWVMSLRRPKNFSGERELNVNIGSEKNPVWIKTKERVTSIEPVDIIRNPDHTCNNLIGNNIGGLGSNESNNLNSISTTSNINIPNTLDSDNSRLANINNLNNASGNLNNLLSTNTNNTNNITNKNIINNMNSFRSTRKTFIINTNPNNTNSNSAFTKNNIISAKSNTKSTTKNNNNNNNSDNFNNLNTISSFYSNNTTSRPYSSVYNLKPGNFMDKKLKKLNLQSNYLPTNEVNQLTIQGTDLIQVEKRNALNIPGKKVMFHPTDEMFYNETIYNSKFERTFKKKLKFK